MDEFNASPSAIGYFYQARYGLYLLVTNGVGTKLSIESLDDVTLDTSSGKTLVQLKHSSSNISDASKPLWKTIRIWSERIKRHEVEPQTDKLMLITTGSISNTTLLNYLKGNQQLTLEMSKNVIKILDDVADKSSNEENRSAYEAYKTLTAEQKEMLIKMITVIDSFPDILEIKEKIKEGLRFSTRPQYLDRVIQRVEGWWIDEITKLLQKRDELNFIFFEDLLMHINDIQEEYYLDSLPIEFSELEPPKEHEMHFKDKIFIEQLKLIALSNNRIQKAMADYFKAFNQRTKWIKDGHIQINCLEKYDKTLRDEWERCFYEIHEDLGDTPSEPDKIKFGKNVFNTLQKRTDLNIKERCTEAYVMRGSFQILANQLLIGWHPDFKECLKDIFKELVE